jgi:lambda family phage tail tape measure protein
MLVLATELGPILKNTVDYFKTLSDSGVSLSGIFKTVFQTVAVLGSEVQWFFSTIFNELAHTYQNAKILVTQGVDAAIAANEKYNASVKASRQNLDFYQGQVMEISYGRTGNDPRRTDIKKPTAGGGGGRVVQESKEAEAARKREMQLYAQGAANAQKAAEEDAKARADFFSSYEKGNGAVAERQRLMGIALENEKELMLLEMNSSNKRQEDYALEREQMLIRQQLSRNLEEIDARRDLTATARAEAEARETALAEKSLAIAKEKYRLTRGLREGTFEEGITKQAQRFLRDMPTELEMGAKAFDSLMGNMESAIDRFVRTGKASFKDLARSIIQDIIAMQMKAMATSFLSSLFGVGPNPYQPASVLGMPGYANGGNPTVGQVSVVGERGPELFVPRTAGTIIPNHALAGVGGTTNVTNYNINAIDTKSFEDRLLGSSTAIWAANKYGEKNLATNYGRT